MGEMKVDGSHGVVRPNTVDEFLILRYSYYPEKDVFSA
jgi:hypothetical protein